MTEPNTDPDFHADPMKERMVAAPWHTAMHFSGDDVATEMMTVYPDYDALDADEDSFFVRVDTLMVSPEGEAAATSILWECRALVQFCRQTLALLHADNVVERADEADELEDEDPDEDVVGDAAADVPDEAGGDED